MKKNTRNLLLGLGTVALLVAVMLLLPRLMAVPEEVSSAPSSSDSSARALIASSADQIARMKVTNENGSFTLLPNPDKESGFDVEGMERQTMYEGFIGYAAANGYTLTALRDFGAAADLEEYGLLKPALTYTVTFTDNTEQTISVGNAVPGQTEAYYAMLAGDAHVYSVNLYALLINGTSLDFLDLTLVQATTDSPESSDDTGETSPRFDNIQIGGTAWKKPVVIGKNKDYGVPATPFYSYETVMTRPIHAACADKGWDALTAQLSSVVADRAVTADVSGESLKKYGFDAPTATISYTMDGVECALVAGKKSETGYYIMKKGGTAIFELGESSLSEWTNGDFYAKTADLVRPYALEDIAEITVTSDGKTTRFTYKPDEFSPENASGGEKGAAYAGDKTLILSNFKNYFTVLTSVRSDGLPTVPVAGEPKVTVTIRFRTALNAPNSTIRFYSAGNRRYNVVYNNEDGYVTVREAYVKKLIEDTEKCAGNLEVNVL